MKNMCPPNPNYHHNGFMATYAFGHIMYGTHDNSNHVP